MQTIFTVQNYDLERLNPRQAVDFFRELLWAEAARIGIGPNKINIPSNIDVPDGGIDASIRDVEDSFDSGLIKAGLNCFQIKAGSAFKPWQESQVKKELFADKSPGKENLGKSIKNCLDNRGNEIYVQQRKLVLQYIALFKRFGYKKPMEGEAKAIAKLLESADPQITWIRFQEIIAKLKQRKILQGEYTLYITPKLLHIKLWTDWWNAFGHNCDHRELLKVLPGSLHEGFYEMLKYSRESKNASDLVRSFLEENGPFLIRDSKRKPPAERFLLPLAEADPGAALRNLKKKIKTSSKEWLLESKIIGVLQQIAVWRELFPDAARLMLALAEAENETHSNYYSSGAAKSFSFFYENILPTEASPMERFPILEEALSSQSKVRRMIALDACDKALNPNFSIRITGPEHQGLREEPQLWFPKNNNERYDGRRQVWELLYGSLDALPEDEQKKAVDLLLRHARIVNKHQDLSDMVIETLISMSQKKYIDTRNVLTTVLEILNFDGKKMSQKTRQRWEKLKDRLTGNDFSALLKRFAGINHRIDKVDGNYKLIDKIKPGIEDLARQAVEKPELLRPELNWLNSIEAQNGYRFGYELAGKDNDFSLLPMLLEAQSRTGDGEKASILFLAGYFRFLFEKHCEKWEQLIEEMVENQNLNYWVPQLVCYTGITDRAALKILEIAKKGIMPIDNFKYFKYHGAVKQLSG